MEAVSDFIFGGSKITADGDCSHEIKRYLLLGTKAMTNLDSVVKSTDITLPTKFIGWRVLTKCGPLEKGMAIHLSILALRTP